MATNCIDYDFSEIEPHWQTFWEQNKTFRAENFAEKDNYYILDMFPYPSGAGLHIGHPEGYTASDILGRFKKANGCNVLHPMGWDAFGLPAEQHAITTGTHPAVNTKANIDNFRRQIKRLGFGLDWDREINTTDPKYFKWTQWIFLQLFKHGLAYVDEKPVWWCPALGTVLANEEVIDGKSERGDHPVERRNLRQWVLRITAYAEKLLAGLDDVDWPASTKKMQEAWIGRSEGAEVTFDIDGHDEKLTVFTTRPDTLFGATYMVVAPEHDILDRIVTDDKRKEVDDYKLKAAKKSDLDRTDLADGKSGVSSGCYAINPVNNKKIPIWVADYVLISYGTGAIMAVPAHDDRDWEFAKKFEIPIIEVIQPEDSEPKKEGCFSGNGKMINSDEYNGQDSNDFKKTITEKLHSEGRGKGTINYKLRDWLFSRQRYWGEPFPIIWVSIEDYNKLSESKESSLKEFLPKEAVSYAKDGKTLAAIPLPSSELPLELPDIESYQPSGTGDSPLANAEHWMKIWLDLETGKTVSSSQDKPEGDNWVEGSRETNTMPQWAGSCWYYLRFLDPDNETALVDPEVEKYWGSPAFYIGGAEHAVLHLLYARFWHRFLHDIGVLKNPEPFKKLFHQGIILGEDNNKMSKSRGNVVSPDVIIDEYGADALRLYEMFLGPLEAMKPWNTKGIEGIARFLRKSWREIINIDGALNEKITDKAEEEKALDQLLHQTIHKVTDDISNLRFNTAISQLMILLKDINSAQTVSRDTIKTYIQLVAPLAPHMAEELWERIGEKPSVCDAPWPKHDPKKLVKDEMKIIFQVNGKLRGEALVSKNATKEEILNLAKSQERVINNIGDKSIIKEIYVPGKIVNIVAK